MSRISTEDRKSVAEIIRSQIQLGIFMTLGASDLGHTASTGSRDYEMAGLAFTARILPFNKSGERSAMARKMSVKILLNAGDLYDIEVREIASGKIHYSTQNVVVFDLNRTLLALDYDGEEVLNPRYV